MVSKDCTYCVRPAEGNSYYSIYFHTTTNTITHHTFFYLVDARSLESEAQKVGKDASDLEVANAPGVIQLSKDDREARDLMKEGYRLRNDSNKLYQKAKDANDQAKKAQEEGLKVAEDAKEMLSTLEVGCCYGIGQNIPVRP